MIICFLGDLLGSHLFQRVASFLLDELGKKYGWKVTRFSSLSESGFIPTNVGYVANRIAREAQFSSLSESGFIPTY